VVKRPRDRLPAPAGRASLWLVAAGREAANSLPSRRASEIHADDRMRREPQSAEKKTSKMKSKIPRTKKPPIKALTIRQPWAELILRGRKPFELRTWRTKYRGPLVVHAAAKIDEWDARHFGLNPENLITSAFVGFAILADVRPYTREDARLLKKRRAGFGWFPGNFSWVLKKPRRISPVKAKGQLSLFKVPKVLERRISRLLSAGR